MNLRILLTFLVIIGITSCYKKNSGDKTTPKEVIIIEDGDTEEVSLSYLFDKISTYVNKSYVTFKGELSNSEMIVSIYGDTKCSDSNLLGIATDSDISNGVSVSLIENETHYVSYTIDYKGNKVAECTTHAVVYQDSILPNPPTSTLQDVETIIYLENNFVFPYFLTLQGVDEDVQKVRFYDDMDKIKEIDYLTLMANQGYITIQQDVNTNIYATFVDRAGNESLATKIATLFYTDITPSIIDLTTVKEAFAGVQPQVNFNFKYTMEDPSDVLLYDLGQGAGEQQIDYISLRDAGIDFIFSEYGNYNMTFKVKRADKVSEIETINAYIGSSNPNLVLTPNTIVYEEAIYSDKGISFSIQNLSTDNTFGIGIPVSPTISNMSSGITYINHEYDCLRQVEYMSYCEMELSINHTTNGSYTDSFVLSFGEQSVTFTIQYDLIISTP